MRVTRYCSLFPLAALLAAGSAQGATVLADAFDDVGDPEKVANTATFGSWDTFAGINAPTSSLSFFDGDDGTTPRNFHAVTDGELDVNNNMTAGGWDTSITITLDAGTSSISLTNLILDMRLTNGGGANNTTGSKQGRMIAILSGTDIATTTVDPGESGYPTVAYTRNLDLSSMPDLSAGETYTLTIQARGSGFGHHKSLQALELQGDITPVPEPSALSLLALASLGLLRRRR